MRQSSTQLSQKKNGHHDGCRFELLRFWYLAFSPLSTTKNTKRISISVLSGSGIELCMNACRTARFNYSKVFYTLIRLRDQIISVLPFLVLQLNFVSQSSSKFYFQTCCYLFLHLLGCRFKAGPGLISFVRTLYLIVRNSLLQIVRLNLACLTTQITFYFTSYSLFLKF